MKVHIDDVRGALERAGILRSSGPSWMAGFAIGAGVGLISGAVVALLVTPSNGREMRRELGWRAKKLAERTQGAISDVAHNVKGKLQQAEIEGRHHGRNEVPVG